MKWRLFFRGVRIKINFPNILLAIYLVLALLILAYQVMRLFCN